jgi:plasmid stabilization system protein ParE
MVYRVELSRRAQQDIEDLNERVSADDSPTASDWFERLKDGLYSLERFPRRCPIAPESRSSGTQLRHLLYGEKRNTYRIVYQINESRRLVNIVTIRHGAMDEFIPRQ